MGVCKVTNNQVITESRGANKKSQNSVIKERRGREFLRRRALAEREREERHCYINTLTSMVGLNTERRPPELIRR